MVKDETQILLVPWFTKPKRRLERSMVHDAWQSLEDADAMVILIDASKPSYDDVDFIFDKLKDTNLLIRHSTNKVDIAKPES